MLMPVSKKARNRRPSFFFTIIVKGVLLSYQLLVRPPGFEPGLSAWEADVLTRLDYGRYADCDRLVEYE